MTTQKAARGAGAGAVTPCFSGEGAEGFIAGPPEPVEALLQTALKEDDAEFLLDLAISGLYTGRMDSRLALWLGRRLERVQKGEDARKLFGLENPEGAPRGKHGSGHYETDQVAALWGLARRRFKRKGNADAAVAKACGLDPNSGSVPRLVREGGYRLDHLDEDMLKVMAGEELLRRVNWPKGSGEN